MDPEDVRWVQKLRTDLFSGDWSCFVCARSHDALSSYVAGYEDVWGQFRAAVVCPSCARKLQQHGPTCATCLNVESTGS